MSRFYSGHCGVRKGHFVYDSARIPMPDFNAEPNGPYPGPFSAANAARRLNATYSFLRSKTANGGQYSGRKILKGSTPTATMETCRSLAKIHLITADCSIK